ncbi:MAG: sigma-70 family RNA polymerase sigma factor [Leptolyngbya sp. SIO3F4]|nr:sigma-70 family RNA polymerase sigma factor [Leptolyngbya sp. SIO3F4]
MEFDARFRRVILSVALRFGLPRADAEEAAQETMLQAYRDYQQGKYDRSRGRLSSWLISIAQHRIIDVKRRERGRDQTSSSAEQIKSIPQNEVMLAFETALERTVFEDAWSWLVEHTRGSDDAMLAFELTAMRGVPVTEAASQCGMTVDQVYVARSRITARIREAVEQINQAIRDGL